MLPLLGHDLDASTLHLYLKESTFVEYFNSFLLLPAFSCRLFFDRESGYFEPVHGEGTKLCWEESTDDVTPSSSQATLYLTDENMGPALDRLQSWSWVVEHRLPLFLKSDIFSEYKLCKLLSQREPIAGKLSLMKSNSNTKLQASKQLSEDKQSEGSLPSILQSSTSSILLSTVSSTSLQPVLPKSGVSASASDNLLLTKRPSLLAGQRSQSMELSPSLLDPHTTKLSKEESKMIASKSGMKNFWKFLRGKAGEKNWLFYLDAERVNYHSNPIDQQRLLREVREKYFHSSGALALPAETRNKARVNKTSKLTLEQLSQVKHILVQGLRDYWCPRFLTHYYTETTTRSVQSRPLSCVQELTNYPRIATPLTPTGTPTVRRLTSGRTRSFSSPTSYRRGQEDKGVKLFDRIKTDNIGISAEESEVSIRSHSRRVWGDKEESAKRGDGAIRGKKSYFDKVAKYTLHHVPDTNSRCASAMDGQVNNSGMCETQCTILSVSGTPLHTAPPTSSHPHRVTGVCHPSMDLYEPLITCLNTEHRKAGGYFQQHLASNQEKVYLHCLVFWRDVQEYKALFVGASFSPCMVEMKAKTLYGRFISQGSEQCIECSESIVERVLANLWPAYEDLFDAAEEHALGLLLLKWVDMVTSEDQLFQKLDNATVRRVSSLGSRRALEELEEESLANEVGDTFFLRPSSSLRISRSHSGGLSGRSSRASSGRASARLVANPDRPISLNDIMKNRMELDQFKIFLNEQCAAQDLMCWMEIEAFRGIPASDKTIRNVKAKQLKGRYFNKSYLFGPNSPANKEAQRQIVSAGGGVYTGRLPARPRTPVFIEAQKYVRQRLEKKWLVEFINTPGFRSRNNGGAIRTASGRRLSTNSKEMPSGYETSFTNSHEALTFRKILHDNDQVNLLLRYVDIKSISSNSSGKALLMRQDITFWLEVQRFKEMFHAHTKESMLTSKARAIMDCFFLSSVPPKLQVNVPLMVAEELTNKPHGPYLFREAQAAVFRYLYGCYLDYRSFASGYGPGEIHAALDKLEAELLKTKRAERESRMNDLMEEEKKKLSIPRFESIAEKLERMRLEKDRSEFGIVQVAFRLSNPSHKYTYYTPLPAKFVERQQALEHPPTTNSHPPTKHTQPPHSENAQTNPLPMTVVTADKQREPHHTVSIDEQDVAMDCTPNEQTQCRKQAHQNSKSSAATAFKRFTVQAKSGKNVKKRGFGYATTISMRRSGEKGGSPFSYGAGLSEQSTITVLNMETLDMS